ncbi:hypothetical protein AOLI_G00080580 [Acnodon oligacanthus]
MFKTKLKAEGLGAEGDQTRPWSGPEGRNRRQFGYTGEAQGDVNPDVSRLVGPAVLWQRQISALLAKHLTFPAAQECRSARVRKPVVLAFSFSSDFSTAESGTCLERLWRFNRPVLHLKHIITTEISEETQLPSAFSNFLAGKNKMRGAL